jgi:hypothetical protein
MTGRVFDSQYDWNMYSADGRTSLGGNFKRTWRSAKSPQLILAEVVLTNAWLDRTSDTISFIDLPKDFQVVFSQIVIREALLSNHNLRIDPSIVRIAASDYRLTSVSSPDRNEEWGGRLARHAAKRRSANRGRGF